MKQIDCVFAPTLNGADGDNVTLGHNMFCITEKLSSRTESD